MLIFTAVSINFIAVSLESVLYFLFVFAEFYNGASFPFPTFHTSYISSQIHLRSLKPFTFTY